MKRYQFSTIIDAPAEAVWHALWSKETYEQWTAAFSEVSKVETDWKTGSEVRFVDGSGNGMISVIADQRKNEFMSFRHEGMIENGVADFDSPKVKEWAGAFENYTLTTVNGKTKLVIDIDITEDHAEMFQKMWPDALKRLRDIAEHQETTAN